MLAQIAWRLRSPATSALLVASLTAFGLVWVSDKVAGMPSLCSGRVSVEGLLAGYAFAWRLFDPVRWALDWLVMFLAMMLPLAVIPVDHIVRTTLSAYLPRSVGMFLAGYATAWLPFGGALSLLANIGQFLSPMAACVLTLVVAMAWSASPVAQRGRNRAHRLPPLAIRGRQAWWDTCAFGFRTGIWCARACWPWMLLAMIVGGLLPMLAVTAVLLAERAMPPGPPRWQRPRVFDFVAQMWPRRRLANALTR